MLEKTKVKLGLKNSAMLPSYFNYTFMHLIKKERCRPESSPKFLSTLGLNPTRKARPGLQLWADDPHTSGDLTTKYQVRSKGLFDFVQKCFMKLKKHKD